MKTAFPLFLLILFCAGCEPRMSGPVGNIFLDEHYWKLDAFLIREIVQPIDSADQVRYLTFPNDPEGDVPKFDFWNSRKEPTFSWNAEHVFFDVDKHRTMGTYIKSVDYRKVFRVTVTIDKETRLATKLELSNLMEGEYQSKNDTIRYFYLPTEKFKAYSED